MKNKKNEKIAYIQEVPKEIPIIGEYDVIVCGGGIGGISAALASQRQGAKTLLIEQAFMLGGLATAGLVAIYLPLCDGNGRQVSFSIAEELLKLSINQGEEFTREKGVDIQAWWGDIEDKEIQERRKNSRYKVQFNHNIFAILCEQLLLEEGVKILYGTSLRNAITLDDKIQAIVCENKSGRFALKAKAFIDATGDADLCVYAGETTDVYQRGNILASWYYEHNQDELRLRMLGLAEVIDGNPSAEKIEKKRYLGLAGEEISEFVCDEHKNILNSFLKDGGITKERSIATIPTLPQFRMTRKLVGAYSMDISEEGKSFTNSVGLFSNWKKCGPIYELPFSCLHGNRIKNLLVCGRCISVSQEMWDVTRVIPVCAVSGEAVGVAAAMSDDTSKIDIRLLQDKLLKNGVKLHIENL